MTPAESERLTPTAFSLQSLLLLSGPRSLQFAFLPSPCVLLFELSSLRLSSRSAFHHQSLVQLTHATRINRLELLRARIYTWAKNNSNAKLGV